MGLKEYQRKRDFNKTPEPAGGRASDSARPIFVVQKHDATRLHFDFRLQIGDVLASWAVPKGPSLDPSHKRLAVHVEDHPLDYADFEGIIPKGQYGGGTVMLWDTGAWTPDHDTKPARDIHRGKLSFTLHGHRLKGSWTLTRIRSARDSDDHNDNWLLIKHDDEHASNAKKLVTETELTSVKTDRTMDQIAADADAVWGKHGLETPKQANSRSAGTSAAKSARKSTKSRNRAPAKTSANSSAAAPEPAPASIPAAEDLAKLDGARKASMPRSPSPQLCTLADHAPTGDNWIHEIKFDGYRLLCRKTSAGPRLITRSGHDWTARFPPLADAIAVLPVDTALIDGEACILDAQGHTSFQQLQNAIKTAKFNNLAFFAFDLLHLNGYDLTRTPLLERKRILRTLIPDTSGALLRFSDHVLGGGRAVEQNACELALEGIVCKKADAPYTQKRSKSWLKVKCSRRQEFVIVGWTPPSGSRKHFGSLLLGAYDADASLHYTGRVGTGFNTRTLKDIKSRLDALARKTSPLSHKLTADERRDAHWVTPQLVAEVQFTEWTDDGRLRHPSFQGLREDKPAENVRVERTQKAEPEAMPASSPKKKAKRTSKKTSARASPTARRAPRSSPDDNIVLGVTITHPDRILYPDQNVTKLELAHYYERVAEHMLPFLTARPLSTVRCPQGRSSQCFFQKHLRETFAAPVKSIRVKEKDGPADYIAIDSPEGLVALIQFGVLEIHPWGSREPHLEQPDLLTFDLDPGEAVDFEAVRDAARLVRTRLQDLGLVPFLKTTGGKGLHVIIPIHPDTDWDSAKAFCHDFAKSIEKEDPARYIATASKAKRKGKIYVDYLRNGRGATAICPYSTRARAGATVAVPLKWSELSRLDTPDHHNISNVLQRLARQRKDPWHDWEASRRSLRGN